ncbi:MAG: hypothetical protein WC556_00570 [Candidatus Methanoperedens sp.]
MTINVHLRKVDEKRYRLFKNAAVNRNISLNRAFEEAIGGWVSGTDEISEDQALNDVVFKRMKKQLVKDFSGKTIVIADGKFIGAEDSLENAWALASKHKNALVTKIEKKQTHAKIRGSSLRMAASERA